MARPIRQSLPLQASVSSATWARASTASWPLIFREVAWADERADGGIAPRVPPTTEHRVYRPRGAGGFEVELVEDGVYAVAGRGVEMLVERHDLGNYEAIGYLERRLREIGVIKALRDAGFEPGDEVRIGEQAFDLDPGDG